MEWQHICMYAYFLFVVLRAKVNAMAVHPTGKIALSVSADRTAIVWNLMTGRKASVNKLGRGKLYLWRQFSLWHILIFAQRNLCLSYGIQLAINMLSCLISQFKSTKWL